MNEKIKMFAEIMQEKLDKNKFKECPVMNPHGTGRKWKHCPDVYLFRRLLEEFCEMQKSIWDGESSDKIARECADIANFAMMIADNNGGLEPVKKAAEVPDVVDEFYDKLMNGKPSKAKYKIIALPIDRDAQKKDVLKSLKDAPSLNIKIGDMGFASQEIIVKDFWQPQQVVVLSNSIEVKERDDVVYQSRQGLRILQNISVHLLKLYKEIPEFNPRKIIAAYPEINILNGKLPTINEEFLLEWVSNPVDEIEVETDLGFPRITENNEIVCSIPFHS